MPVFGPVPSRRLGNSLGINNIPPKICTYACRYCQLGKTLKMSLEPQPYLDPFELCREVEDKLAVESGNIDYLTVVPDGEPTLDGRLGELVKQLKTFAVPVAIISNASLVDRPGVRHALSLFDWVSLKVDAVTESVWKKLDRPHPSLELQKILEGVRTFREEFGGLLNTETMLVKDINDGQQEMEAISDFLAEVRPDTAWISLPLRPPAESDALPAEGPEFQEALKLFRKKVAIVEALNFPEGDAFSASGPDLARAILEITSVHPIRETALRNLLLRKGADWSLVEGLLNENLLLEKSWQGDLFYRRNLETII